MSSTRAMEPSSSALKFNISGNLLRCANGESQFHGSICPNVQKHGAIQLCKLDVGKYTTSKAMKAISKRAFPFSSSSLLQKPSELFSIKHMRTLDFKLLQISENDLYGNTHQYARRFKEKSSGKTAIMSIRSYDTQIRFLSYAIETWFRKLLSDGRKKFVAWIVTIICLTCPTVTLNDNASISVSNNMAYAQSLGSIRQAALFLERLGGSTPAKVLDKVVTVISGQAVVTPETVEQLKSILEEKDPEDWKRDITNGVETLWSTAVDVISHFDPISLLETTGNSIQGLVEAGAERFAAFELSALVSLGERWILWTPFVILPMYWQMTKNKNDELASGSSSKSQVEITELSEEAIAKAARVKNELERIELKASLLDLVYSLGKLTWQSNRTDENPKRKQIDEILARLQVLNPTSAIALEIVPLAPDGTAESPYVQPLIDVDGDWNLLPSCLHNSVSSLPFHNIMAASIAAGVAMATANEFLGRFEPSEVISMAMKNATVFNSSSTVIPFHCDLAPSYGKLKEKGYMKEMDDELKVIIAGTTRSMTKLVEQAKGNNIEWGDVVATMSQNPLLEPYDDQIEKSDKYIKTESAAFKFDGSPDETIVREVKTWFLNLISDEDILHDTRIDIDVLAKIVAESGARVTDFETLFYKKATQESKVLDIGVLRYPDIDHPFFKVYRIQLTAWSTCERILFQQSDTHGITGEFSCRKYKPRASVIQKLSEKVTQKAVQEAEDLFS